MNYKIENLTKKIFRNFIAGKYNNGIPKIPTKSDVINKIEEITSVNYVPLTKKIHLSEPDVNIISSTLNNIIDDLDILYDSIESQSKDILEQLTSSLEEHRGVKRELRNIDIKTNDINEGKFGEEYINYNFTEKFNDLQNINILRSDTVDLQAGLFNIKSTNSENLTLQHYYGKKLQINITDYFGNIVNDGYVGTTDIAAILNPDDSRGLIYKVKLNRAESLKMNFSLQLTPDGRAISINKIVLVIDSKINHGSIRIYYRNGFKWVDLPGRSSLDITGDKIEFNFQDIESTHIKVEFIKDLPDVPDTYEYFLSINDLSISLSNAAKKAVLYSKPITLQNYSNENTIVSHISCNVTAYIPTNSNIKVFVAPDLTISGQFKDLDDNIVPAGSSSASTFDPTAFGYVFLSDMWNSNDSISGIIQYRTGDFNWQEIKTTYSNNDNVPEIISFNNTKAIDALDNSLYCQTNYLWGDQSYSGPWPTEDISPVWFISGWCNTDNSSWEYLEPLVLDGTLVSGIDIANELSIDYEEIEDASGNLNPLIIAHPDFSGQWLGYAQGYPYNFYNNTLNSHILFNDASQVINGWYRPYVNAITPSGLNSDFTDSYNQLNIPFINSDPDFYFNGIGFYKIYQFGKNDNVIQPTIKLYHYEQRPTNYDNDYYPHNFIWKYQTSWEFKTKLVINQKIQGKTSFENYVLPIESLNSNQEFVIDSIDSVSIYNSNTPLFKGSDFYLETETTTVNDESSTNLIPTGINLSPLQVTHSYLDPSTTLFSYIYNYREKNEYLSTWTGYAIIQTSTTNEKYINFGNPQNNNNIDIIQKIIIENMDNGVIHVIEKNNNQFKIDNSIFQTDNDNIVSHFKITIYCLSDETTGFSAKHSNTNQPWIPFEGIPTLDLTSKLNRGRIDVSPGIKIVSNITPIKIVDISDLIYNTTIQNEEKASIYKELDGNSYIVVKEPSKDTFPGYYYSENNLSYSTYDESKIANIGHYSRKGFINNSTQIQYTTGSSGVYVYNSENSAETDTKDTLWNNGDINISKRNTDETVYYPTHSTYGFPINLDKSNTFLFSKTLKDGMYDLRANTQDQRLVGSDAWLNWINENDKSSYDSSTPHQYPVVDATIYNRGFLYYNTAENLPTYYSITYRTIDGLTDLNSRFLYKIELGSTNKNGQVPEVDAIRFIINGE